MPQSSTIPLKEYLNILLPTVKLLPLNIRMGKRNFGAIVNSYEMTEKFMMNKNQKTFLWLDLLQLKKKGECYG